MQNLAFRTAVLAIAMTSFSAATYAAGLKDALDPDCTVEKAAEGAAMKATIGIGNRCGAAETIRDTTGVDGVADDAMDAINPKSGKKTRKIKR